jgi:redox-sensitive bicupin YhaK (pirin superfamily)
MIKFRRSAERGHFDHGWLNTYHTFSFAAYRDPQHMGFRALRVINEDRVQTGHGFGAHDHKDMEIISYVLEGELEHADSMGNGTVIRPGDVQRMSAGRGVTHSERNPSRDKPAHFLQIWLYPHTEGLDPSYEQKHFSDADKAGRLRLVASPDGRDGSVTIHQDVLLWASMLEAGQQVHYELAQSRHAWLQVVRGALELNGTALSAGDGAAISDEQDLTLTARERTELLLFDLS